MKTKINFVVFLCAIISDWTGLGQDLPLQHVFQEGLNNEYEAAFPANLKMFGPDNSAKLDSGSIIQFSNGEENDYIVAYYTSFDDPNAGWNLELILGPAMTWDEWSNQGFPASYRDDSGTVTDEYLDWTYYIVTCGTLKGWGTWEGSELELQHTPINNYYGLQMGINANGYNSEFGATTWATASGTVYSAESNSIFEASPSLTFNFDLGESSTASQSVNTTIADLQDQSMNSCEFTGFILDGVIPNDFSQIQITQTSGCLAQIDMTPGQEITISNLGLGSSNFLISNSDICGTSIEHTFTLSLNPCTEDEVICTPFSAGPDVDWISCFGEIPLQAELPCGQSGEWSILSGFGNFSNLENPNAQFDAGIGTIELLWSMECDGQTLTDTLIINNFSSDSQQPEDGMDIDIDGCILTSVQLEGSSIIGPGEPLWTQLSGCPAIIEDPFDQNTVVSNIGFGESIFSWQYEDICGNLISEEISVNSFPCEEVVLDCTPFSAGTDQEIINCEFGTQLEAEVPCYGEGTWHVISGEGSFSDIHDPSAEYFSESGVQVLEWEFTCNGEVISDQVVINVQLYDPAFSLSAGEDITLPLCDLNELTLNGSSTSQLFTPHWTQIDGSPISWLGDTENPSVVISDLTPGVFIFSYQTEDLCGELISDEITVTLEECDSDCPGFSAGPDQIFTYCCNPPSSISFLGNLGDAQDPSWEIIQGSGNINNPNSTLASGTIGEGENCLVFSATCFGQIIQDTVYATLNQDCPTISAGINQELYLCEGEVYTSMTGDPALGLDASWQIIEGEGAFIEDEMSETSSVLFSESGEFLIEWSYDLLCGSTISDTVSIAVFDQFEPDEICEEGFQINLFEIPDSYTLSSLETPEQYSGIWSQISGPNSSFIENSNSYSTTISDLDYGTYVFEWAVSDPNCEYSFTCLTEMVITDPVIYGCTHDYAINFDPNAEVDNGTCQFDFNICDCNDNIFSPYVTLQLGDGNPNDSEDLNFNCETWGYDCGDIIGSPDSDPYNVCNGFMPPQEGCSCSPVNLIISGGEDYLSVDSVYIDGELTVEETCFSTINLTPIIQGNCPVQEICFEIDESLTCLNLIDIDSWYYSMDTIQFETSVDAEHIHFHFITISGQSAVYPYYNPECIYSVFEESPSTLSIYPNPANNQLNLHLTGFISGQTDLKLYNTLGQSILNESIFLEGRDYVLKLNRDNLPTGMYWLKLISKDLELTTRVILE